MSGICGIIRFDGKAVEKEDIHKMLDIMQNRGSDAEDIWVNGNVGFGHKMLWTTPESLHESQPLVSKDSNLVLTADARIDNRDELIQKLEIDKNMSDVVTDPDLILFAYQQWGEECPKQLVGDFAFTIWDISKKKLFCARDRLGFRPFNYVLNDKFLIFCSEIEPLLEYGEIDREIDEERLREYLFYWAIDRHDSFYKNVKRLPPAQKMNVNNRTSTIDRYWFPERINVDESMSIEEAVEGFYFHFREAVRSCMRSAYPIAFEVSGGVDSSSVFAVGSSIKTTQQTLPYHIHYKDLSCDESEFVDILAEKFKTPFLKIDTSKIDYKGKYNFDFLYKNARNWPANGTFIEHLYKHEILEQNKVRVALTGIGGDEVMSCACGYLQEYAKEGKWRKVFREIKCVPIPLLQKLKIIILMILPRSFKNFLKIVFRKKIKEEEEILKYTRFPLAQLEELILDQSALTKRYQHKNIEPLLSNQTAYWADMNTTQLSGKNHIEFRHPFYDSRLIEFVSTIPPEYKKRCGVYKNILKVSMQNILPKEILERQDIPLQSESLRKQIDDMYLSEILKIISPVKKNFIAQEDINYLRKQYYNGTLNEEELMNLWTVVNLLKWRRKDKKEKNI